MDKTSKKITIWLAFFVTISASVDGICNLDSLNTVPCSGRLSCTGDFVQAINLVRDWSCRRHESYNYNSYGHRRVTTSVDEDYTLYIYVNAMEESASFDKFSAINELSDHISKISITNGNITSIPTAILGLRKAVSVDLSHNMIQALKLEAFSRTNLKMLNVSFNLIADLETEQKSVGTGLSQLTTIDLSHNAVETIPKNYFRKIPQLLHLNLSYNFIESFDILTFEGIAQLETLHVSNNKLSKLSLCFARFVDLKELYLDHNYLTSIEQTYFDTMSRLEVLNVSHNNLINIDSSSFDHLVALTKLDISHNKIELIPKTWFSNNKNLHSLDVSSNYITKIEPGAFKSETITDFEVNNNKLTGCLEENTFQGIYVTELDLSSGKVTELGPHLFSGLGDSLQALNLSGNSISKIDKSTFNKLRLLINLDLSNNRLENLDFFLSDLKNLSKFYMNNNLLKNVTRNTFQNLTNLKIIDLSNNNVDVIEALSFKDLNELESLTLSNNPLLNVIAPQTFSGLTSCTNLDIKFTEINTIQNNAFNGMNSLKILNISYSDLNILEFNTFNGTASIKILDLSHNQIDVLNLNNTNIKLVKKIDLGHNKLQHITHTTFSGLTYLKLLNLNHNNIVRIENDAFLGLQNLFKIDLAFNRDLVFDSSIFANVTSVKVLYLKNVSVAFNFKNVINTSISDLDLSFCSIVDLDSVQLSQIETVERLQLTSNKIRSIDKLSFQKLRKISWIDLSNNMISHIQPGSFSDLENLSVLMLNGNFLSSLQFGVFDGLVNLQDLDLSSNTLNSFRANLFHNIPHVQKVYLDDNLIDEIDFDEFAAANINKLGIGGNPISCLTLTKFKKNNKHLKLTVMAKELNYDTENVDGITCKSMTAFVNITQFKGNETVVTAALLDTIDQFRVTVERILSRNESNTDIETIGFKNVSTSIEHFLVAFNESAKSDSVLLEKLMSLTNKTNMYLKNIQEYLKERNDSKDNVPKFNDDDIEKTITGMLEKQKQLLKSEFENMFDDWKSLNLRSKQIDPQPANVSDSVDLRFALYFIATCLFALLCVMVLKYVFIFYFKFRTRVTLSDGVYTSNQPLSNDMEME